MLEINWIATAVAAVIFFVIGAIWFSKPVFLTPWMKSAGLADDYAQTGSQPLILVGAFVLIAIMAVLLAVFTDPLDFAGTVGASLAAGLGWAALSFWMLALFERKSFTYVAINAGYLVVGFTAMGVILGLWK